METVKCKKCGCVMGAASEVCPVCGTFVHQQDEYNADIEAQTTALDEVLPQIESETLLTASTYQKDIPEQTNRSNGTLLYILLGILAAGLIVLGFVVWKTMDKTPSEDTATNNTEVKRESDETDVTPTAKSDVSEPPIDNNSSVELWVYGYIGESSCSEFCMQGKTGYYTVHYDGAADERRTLKISSYDEGSGHLVLNAYFHGNYIGQFDGYYSCFEEELEDGDLVGGCSYDCIFTSTSGLKLECQLFAD